MVNESSCNTLVITDLLQRDHPEIANVIIEVCGKRHIEIIIIKGANHYWCRDFMPLQVNKEKLVQFVYDPTYYKHPKYLHLKTDVEALSYYPQQTIVQSNIVLDGGNICYHNNKAVITDKLFRDNPDKKKNSIINEITALLELDEIYIIPSLPYDITGHADGMVRFINDDNLIVNDFTLISSKSHWNKLLKALEKFNFELLPNELHKNKIKDDATGDYINIVIIKDLVFIPFYESAADNLALGIIQTAFPEYTIIQMPSKKLSVKGGIFHCATWNLLQ